MSPRWGGWRREPVPADVSAALAAYRTDPGAGEAGVAGGSGSLARTRERILAWAADARTGQRVVATEFHLYVVGPEGGGDGHGAAVLLARPWHLVDSGVWERDSSTMRITWVDRATPSVFLLLETNELPETLRERVHGTVVLSELVDLGEQRTARVVLRRDLARGTLVTQTILGRGVRSTDPGVLAATEVVLTRLREQVGLD